MRRRSLVDSIRGDMAEERERRLKTQSRGRVRLWHARTALGIALHVGVRRVAERVSDLAGAARMTHLRADVRQSARALARSPWYAATAAVVVALSFALATTVFALVDGVLFKPLPYRAPQQLFVLSPAFKAYPNPFVRGASSPDVRAWAAAAPEIGIATFTLGGPFTIADQETLPSAEVDDRLFDVLGVRPMLGGFTNADFGPPALVRPALISYRTWIVRFGGDPDIVGRTFSDRKGSGIRVAGILGPDFVFPHPAGSVAPAALLPLPSTSAARLGAKPDVRWLLVLARVPDGSVATLESRLTASTAAVAAIFPLPPPPPGTSEVRKITRGPFDLVHVLPLPDVMVESSHTVSAALFAIAAALVVLASLNLAGLTAGRALDRRRELALRRALGGTGAALARLFLVENAIVIGAGTVGGVVASRWLLDLALQLLPSSLLLLKPPAVDGRVIAFAILAAVMSVAIVTFWSVRVALRPAKSGSVAAAAGTTEATRSSGRTALVAAEVAIALLLAVGAALVNASLVRVWRQPTGFDMDRTAALFVAMPSDGGADYVAALLNSVRKAPGVRAVGGLGYPFLQNASIGSGYEPPAGVVNGDTEHVFATAGIFNALGLTLREGVWPPGDAFDRQRVIVVSQDVADRFWPGRSAIGQQLTREDRVFDVVAVVGDTRFQALDREPTGSIYASINHLDRPSLQNLIVSFDGDPSRGLEDVVAALAANHPEIRVRTARAMIDALGASSSVQRRTFQTWLFSSFGVAGLVIAGVGVLGSIAMAVSRRTRELGVRMALGATRQGIVGLIVREQMTPVLFGLAAGTAIGLWGVRFVRSLLFETTPYDWTAWSIALGVIVAVALTACLIPAWRAGRIDPVIALRVDG